MTILDEDENLTQSEKDWALQGYEDFDLEYFKEDPVAFVIWMTDYISSAAAGESNWGSLNEQQFVDFVGKLGLDDATAREAFTILDCDASGDLGLGEQDMGWGETFDIDMGCGCWDDSCCDGGDCGWCDWCDDGDCCDWCDGDCCDWCDWCDGGDCDWCDCDGDVDCILGCIEEGAKDIIDTVDMLMWDDEMMAA